MSKSTDLHATPSAAPFGAFSAGILRRPATSGLKAKQARTPPQPCASALAGTIFHEPWWMDIASGGSWSEAQVSSGGRTVGRMPFQVSRSALGTRVLHMPSLVHVLGPAITPCYSGASSSSAPKCVSIVHQLIDQLPRASHIHFRLHGGLRHTLAFEAAGFTSKAGFSVEISPDSEDALWRALRDKTRNGIRRAREQLYVSTSADAALFLDFYHHNLNETRRTNFYDRDVCKRLVEEALRRNTGRMLFANDAQGNPKAAIFTVWDQSTEFYLLSTRAPDSANGATSLLIWEALKHASALGLTFDMDGLHVVKNCCPNLLLLTGFGGTIVPRYQVHRSSTPVHLASSVRECWQRFSPKRGTPARRSIFG